MHGTSSHISVGLPDSTNMHIQCCWKREVYFRCLWQALMSSLRCLRCTSGFQQNWKHILEASSSPGRCKEVTGNTANCTQRVQSDPQLWVQWCHRPCRHFSSLTPPPDMLVFHNKSLLLWVVQEGNFHPQLVSADCAGSQRWEVETPVHYSCSQILLIKINWNVKEIC